MTEQDISNKAQHIQEVNQCTLQASCGVVAINTDLRKAQDKVESCGQANGGLLKAITLSDQSGTNQILLPNSLNNNLSQELSMSKVKNTFPG